MKLEQYFKQDDKQTCRYYPTYYNNIIVTNLLFIKYKYFVLNFDNLFRIPKKKSLEQV